MDGNEEKIEDRLGDAIRLLTNRNSKEQYTVICRALVEAYVKNMTGIVPMIFRNLKPCYGTLRIDATRYAYRVYTVSEKRTPAEGEMEAFIPWRSIIDYALKDEEAEGIIINPPPIIMFDTAVAFLPKDNLQIILLEAERILNQTPGDGHDEAAEKKRSDADPEEAARDIYRLARKRISTALNAFYRSPGEQTVNNVLGEITKGYMFNVLCFIAMEEHGVNGRRMTRIRCPLSSGDVYIMFTSAEEAEKYGSPVACMTYRDAIRKAEEDKDITGFYIDPQRNRPTAVMTRQNIGAIIEAGETQIGGFGEDLKDALKAWPDEPQQTERIKLVK